jgi:hypothetical protein
MIEDQRIALTADLAAIKSAVVFDSLVRDRMIGKPIDAAALSSVKTQIIADAKRYHDTAVARLRDELTNDPEDIGYAGKTAEEIQFLLTHKKEFVGDAEGPTPMQKIIDQVLAELVTRPIDLVIFKDGTVEGHLEISNRIGVLAGQSGLSDAELNAPTVIQQVVKTVEPRVGAIWGGIPYCENVPSIDVINEAMK